MPWGRTRVGKRSMVVVVVMVVGRRRRVRRQVLVRLVMPGRCLPVDRIPLVDRSQVLAFGVCSGASVTARYMSPTTAPNVGIGGCGAL
jgi:hypothetical protein